MSESPTTELAILGALSVEPMSGYAVRNAIQTVLGHFWSESFGQIYPALASLEQRGLIERRAGTRANASLFAPTPAGEERLRELLETDIPDRPPRLGRLLRLYFGRRGHPDAARSIVEQIGIEADLALEAYAAIYEELDAENIHVADVPYWRMTVSYGEHLARARKAWATESLQVIADLKQPSTSKERGRG